MTKQVLILALGCCCCFFGSVVGNSPPVLTKDLDKLVLSEATRVGDVVFQLTGSDPEGSPIKYGIMGTDRLEVDPVSGKVKVVKPLDREVNDTLRFVVTLEDEVGDGTENNVVRIPVYVIILDENDNPPAFRDVPYETSVLEDTPIGSTVFHGIKVEDPDQLGDSLDVMCVDLPQFPDACSKFEVVTLNASERSYFGAVVLRQPLDYSLRQFYHMSLVATDGKHNSSTGLEVKVGDVQNSPPVFLGSLAGVVPENASIGTLVMTVKARDGDRGQPRKVTYELVTNPLGYFLLDPETGELRTARPLDKEALPDSTGVLTIIVRAREMVNGSAISDVLTESTAELTVTIKDVNDEPPRFNRREYSTSIPENVAHGTLLPHLDMIVKDPDVGINSAFTLRLEDVSGAFQVEPTNATGSTSVSIRVANGTLDYEDPNQRKFIVLVIAEEENTNPKLSSTATVTVTITDANDNTPEFDSISYSASIPETASPGTVVKTITATDRDSGRFGENGLIYSLDGDGAENFTVNNRTGVIAVADCPTPGSGNCLNYENRAIYYLSYRATDNDGKGQSTVVPLRITLLDSNDNSPQFVSSSYRVAIDEGATHFEPPLQVLARDQDKTSEIVYSILEGNINNMFSINPHSGEITVNSPNGIDMTNTSTDHITLIVQASDGTFASTTSVHIMVRDVNNNAPFFERESYVAFIEEDTPIGTSVEQTSAKDADTGLNAKIKFRIQKGAFDDFAVDEETGLVTVVSKLDYDRRNVYNIELIAVDGGTPALTGTTTVTVSVLNSNDKDPVFEPPTQRAEVTENAPPNTVFYTLKARDPDVNSTDALNFALAEPISAVDKNGKQVTDTSAFKSFFSVDRATGEVSVASELKRDIAAVVRLTVLVTDITAPTTQQGRGILVITIIDVNDYPPMFAKPWTPEFPHYTVEMLEEQPVGTVVGTFVATDQDSKIAGYTLEPESDFFDINNATGTVRTKKRVDYEQVKSLNFTVVAYDSGEPQKSATADVTVNIININDMNPVFSQQSYNAEVLENARPGTHVVTVSAVDGDEGVFGTVTYSLVGEHSKDFSVGHDTGEITVGNTALLNREVVPDLTLQVMASDGAPSETRRTASVPVHIKLLDENDNPPIFSHHTLDIQIDENLPVSPPSPITQVRAEDADEGENGAVRYSIISGNENNVFHLDPVSGILYPATSLEQQPREFHLVVEGRDGMGQGKYADNATINIRILDVNQHAPVFVMPAFNNATIEVPENAGLANYLVMTVKATDEDHGENGRIGYHFKVDNMDVQETDEFTINMDSGELRTKIILDREVRANYSLVLVARDYGKPTPKETLQFLTILLVDTDDNKPEFPMDDTSLPYRFKVPENSRKDLFIGKVTAVDRDEGKHARVYYHILSGNDDGGFYVDKTDGGIFTNKSFDRELKDEYNLYIKASNEPDLYLSQDELKRLEDEHDPSVAHVQITILDENDNSPHFEQANYYAGVNAMANINEFVVKLTAEDPDLDVNGSIIYFIAASNLFKFGSKNSSGSLTPSPFNVTEDGKIVTANYMAEYNQERIVLDVVAKERAPPGREAHARVHVWIYEPQQLIRVILSRPPEEVNEERNEIVAELSNITQSLVVVDDIRYHVDSSSRIHRDWCDMYLHVVDSSTQTIASIPEVLKVIDAKYDYLKDYYAGFAIENIIPAFVSVQEETFDTALAALIALVIVLFVGSVTFIVVCCCLRHWVIAAPSDLKKKEALIKKEIIDDLTNTTENPLWIEQKLKLYEEQELTMQVFCEPEGPGSSPPQNQPIERRTSVDFSQVDNTYATIQHPPRQSSEDLGDYATLSGGGAARHGGSAHSSVRGTPRDMYEGTLGFQGSTFQVPEQALGGNSLDPYRPRTALTINKDGQPEFVAELI
ncbi:cadherin-87A [Anabrus simplex]|uniref:cadherin-87A n=1 Tax=Anabrus simplex TaxID=316456 RepID=UPI0035A330FD